MATINVKLVCIVRIYLREKHVYLIVGFKVYHASMNENSEDV